MYTQSKYFYKILGLSLASVGTFYFPQVEFDIFYWRHIKNVEIKKTKKKKIRREEEEEVGLVYGYTQIR